MVNRLFHGGHPSWLIDRRCHGQLHRLDHGPVFFVNGGLILAVYLHIFFKIILREEFFRQKKIDSDLALRSEEHTSELQSLMRISYAVFCLKKKKTYRHKVTTSTLYTDR